MRLSWQAAMRIASYFLMLDLLIFCRMLSISRTSPGMSSASMSATAAFDKLSTAHPSLSSSQPLTCSGLFGLSRPVIFIARASNFSRYSPESRMALSTSV